MTETRAGRYGVYLSHWVDYTISQMAKPKVYRLRFLEELKAYSFKKRKKGQKKHEGCIWEFANKKLIDIKNPEDLAKLVKEGIHLMYQKDTASKVLTALVSEL
jgi:hypothetical protein